MRYATKPKRVYKRIIFIFQYRIYHIEPSPRSKKYVLLYYLGVSISIKNCQWGYVAVPIFSKKKTSKLFEGFNMVHSYIDDVLVITKNNYKDYPK